MNQHIKVNNLGVRYGARSVLKNVSFTADGGEFVVIVGKSGSGKTTLLNALANLIPSTGEVQINGSIGFVFQHHAVFPWATIAQNIGFGLTDKNPQEKNRIISEHLELIGLENERDIYPAQLSGGQIQRVALARSLACNPEVILMDEPYGSLDAYTREKMQEWLLKIWATHKKTILFVTHDIEEAVYLADRILILDKGRLLKEKKIPFLRPRDRQFKLTNEFMHAKRDLFATLEASCPVEQLRSY